MKKRLLEYLACPSCAGALRLTARREDGIEVMEGELACDACARSFLIERGIPRFADLAELERDKQATAEKFGWSWQTFTHEDEKYAAEFLGWIAPVVPSFFVSPLKHDVVRIFRLGLIY